MGKFDFSAWKDNKLAYLVLVIVLVLIIVMASNIMFRERKGKGIPGRTPADGNGTATYYGRGSREDSVQELLDRIDWASYGEKRTTRWTNYAILTIIAAFLVCILVMKKIPRPENIVILLVVIFIPFYAGHQLQYVHGDIYNDYYIKRNVELLRKKLGTEKGQIGNPKSEAPRRALVMNPN